MDIYRNVDQYGQPKRKVEEWNLPSERMLISTLTDELRKCSQPLIGIEYISEVKVEGPFQEIFSKFDCGVCLNRMPIKSVVEHLCGRKHRQNYFKLHAPSYYDQVSEVSNIRDVARLTANFAREIERQNGRGMIKLKDQPETYSTTSGDPYFNQRVELKARYEEHKRGLMEQENSPAKKKALSIFYEQLNECEQPLIGLEYITQVKIQGQSQVAWLNFNCGLCDIQMPLKGVIPHLVGNKHRQIYFKHLAPDYNKLLDNAKASRPYNVNTVTLLSEKFAREIERQKGRPSMKDQPTTYNTDYCKTTSGDPYLNEGVEIKAHYKEQKRGLMEKDNSPTKKKVLSVFYEELNECEQPLIGLDYITEVKMQDQSQGSWLQLNCGLCNIQMPIKAVIPHLVGNKHRQIYFQHLAPDYNKLLNDAKARKPYNVNTVTLLSEKFALEIENHKGRGNIRLEDQLDMGEGSSDNISTGYNNKQITKKKLKNEEQKKKTSEDDSLLFKEKLISELMNEIRHCRLPLIGLNYLSEVQMPDVNDEPCSKFDCSMCSNRMAIKSVMEHITGKKHRINYFKLHAPKYSAIMQTAVEKKSNHVSYLAEKLAFDIERQDGKGEMKVFTKIHECYNTSDNSFNQQSKISGTKDQSYELVEEIYSQLKNCAEPLLGLEFVTEVKLLDFKQEPYSKFSCTVCNTYMPVKALIQHLTGKKHRENYFKLHAPKYYDKLMEVKESAPYKIQSLGERFAQEIEKEKGRGTIKLKNSAKLALKGKSGKAGKASGTGNSKQDHLRDHGDMPNTLSKRPPFHDVISAKPRPLMDIGDVPCTISRRPRFPDYVPPLAEHRDPYYYDMPSVIPNYPNVYDETPYKAGSNRGPSGVGNADIAVIDYNHKTESVDTENVPDTTSNMVQGEKSIEEKSSSLRIKALEVMCKISIHNLHLGIDEMYIREAFSPFGNITSIEMSIDQDSTSERSRAIVVYEVPEAAVLALEQMDGTLIYDLQIKVGRPNNSLNTLFEVEEILKASEKYHRIYISNLREEIGKEEIVRAFEAFGKVVSCKLPRGRKDRKDHRGYCFLEFDSAKSVEGAVHYMNLLDLGGQLLRVRKACTAPNVVIPLTSAETTKIIDRLAADINVDVRSKKEGYRETSKKNDRVRKTKGKAERVETSSEVSPLLSLNAIRPVDKTRATRSKRRQRDFASPDHQQRSKSRDNNDLAAMPFNSPREFIDEYRSHIEPQRDYMDVDYRQQATESQTNAKKEEKKTVSKAAALIKDKLKESQSEAKGQSTVVNKAATAIMDKWRNNQRKKTVVSKKEEKEEEPEEEPVKKRTRKSRFDPGPAVFTSGPSTKRERTTGANSGDLASNRTVVFDELSGKSSIPTTIPPPLIVPHSFGQHQEEKQFQNDMAELMEMAPSYRAWSRVMVLRNMVDADGVDEYLERDVTEECASYGKVLQVIIYHERQGDEEGAEVLVKIFVEFLTEDEMNTAIKSLNGTCFDNKVVIAQRYSQEMYSAGDLSG